MTIASARDGKLLDSMVNGGMRYAFIGFDSIVQKSLAGCHKTSSTVDHFSPLIAELKARGVFIVAALVFGFDHDEPSVFERCLDWAMTTGVDVLNLNVLRPYPSSPMYQELRSADRLLVDPWWLATFSKRLELVHHLTPNVSGVMTTFHPRHMSAYDLAAGTLWLGQQFYKLSNTLPRLLRNRASLPTLVVDALTAASYSREYRSWVPVDNPARNRPVGSLDRTTLLATSSEAAFGNG
jgi:hypothetical protein